MSRQTIRAVSLLMKGVLLFALMAPGAFSETTTFRAQRGIIEKIWTFLKKPISTVTYTLGNGATNESGQVVLDLSISTDRMPPAGLQWELNYDPVAITQLTVAAGPVAIEAEKDVQCNAIGPGTLRCILVGMNSNVIPDGVAAQITITIQTQEGPTPETTTVSLANLVTSTKWGTALTSVISPGGGVIDVTQVLADLSCPQTDIEPNEQVACVASLNRPALFDTSVTVTYDDAALTGPASVTVPSGQDSVTVIVVGH